MRNLAATSSPFNASLGASPELSGNAGLNEMPRLVSVHAQFLTPTLPLPLPLPLPLTLNPNPSP